MSLPKMSLPKMSQPKISLPKVSLPKMLKPKMSLSKMSYLDGYFYQVSSKREFLALHIAKRISSASRSPELELET